MGPKLYEEQGKWIYEYGLFPKLRMVFDTKEEAESAFDDVWEKHVSACEAFRATANMLASYAGREVH